MQKLVAPETPVLKLSATFLSDSKVEEFKALFASRQMDSPLRAFAGGNLIGSKGVDLALRAIRLAKDRGVIIPYTVASFGPEKEYLEKLAARLEIMSQITFHAGFQGQEYQKALMEHSVFLLPSFREGSPGTILEAMLAGQIPVVVKASAQGEIVDSACGFPVRVGSKNQICEELAKALIRLHEIPDLRKALSDASHKKIQNEYCTSHFENKLEAAYRAALGKKPLPPCPKV
jgi:glycosyltransferase involved in cell wall biosynthesis